MGLQNRHLVFFQNSGVAIVVFWFYDVHRLEERIGQMQDFTIQTNNVCATQISFSLENGKLHNIKFKGGCPGNTQAISKLLEGADAQRTVELLKGNDCRGKGTSCADQLARGIEEALSKSTIAA